MTTSPPTIRRGIATAGADDLLDAGPDLCPPAAAVVPAPPWRPGSGARPGHDEVTLIRRRPVATTVARAVSVVQHFASLPVWERKARRIEVDPRGRHGTYTVSGRIAGLVPWRATFRYELTDAGFHSWMPGPKMGVQVAAASTS